VTCEVTEAHPYDMVARIIDPDPQRSALGPEDHGENEPETAALG